MTPRTPRPARSLLLALLVLAPFACSAADERGPVSPTGPIPRPLEPGPPSTSPTPGPPASAPTTPPPAAPPVASGGNVRIRSFDEAKRALKEIYERHRIDLYCGCTFLPEPGRGLRVELAACGYVVAKDATRAGRIEWEHAVAASRFGRRFPEWTSGSDRCVDGRGKRYKGRRCAGTSPEFSRMEGDMHNLFPVVGEVNALRSDLPMGLLDPLGPTPKRALARVTFGACRSAIEGGVFSPRPEVRGDVARASLYMDRAYPSRRVLDEEHRALFVRWSADDPPDAWERERNRLIAERQGNGNPLIEPGVTR